MADDGLLAQAEVVATKVVAKVSLLLDPLEREMRVMGWDKDFRVILWDAVAHEAITRSVKLRMADPDTS